MSVSVALWIAFMAKSAIVLALALVVAECCRGSAAFRHAVRSLALVAALLLPVAALLLPNWEWRILPAPSPVAQSYAPMAGSPYVAERSTPPKTSGKSLNAKPAQSTLPSSEREAPDLYSAKTQGVAWNWPLVLLLTWLGGATVLAIRVSKGIFAVHRLLGRARPVRDGEWLRDLAIVAAELKIRRPISLLESSEIDVPMTYGFFYPRLLLPATASSWQPSRRNAVIFHELAHIVRLDSLSQLFALLAEVVYWPNPLVWWHSSRMRLERERACDDFVLRHGTRASEYANQLLEMASGNEIFPRLVLPMARRSQLKTRLLALLDPATRRESVSKNLLVSISALTFALVSALAAVQISAAPAEVAEARPVTVRMAQTDQPATPPAPAEKETRVQSDQSPASPMKVLPPSPSSACFVGSKASHRNVINKEDGVSSWNMVWSNDTCSATARSQGNVSFSPDSSTLQDISPGGYLEASERLGPHTRYIKVTPQQGQLKYEYSINGQPQAFDAEAQAWFAAFLLGVERVSGMNARKRAPYLLERGGPEAILNELPNTPSDYVSGIYVRTLLEGTKLTPQMLQRTLQGAAQRIESDYELGRILTEIATRYPLDDEASRLEFLKASSTLQSDYERSRVLIQLLQRPDLSAAIVGMAMKSAAEIKSDHEKGRLLLALASQKQFTEPMHQLYLQAASGIASDYERARTLLTLMEHARLSDQLVANLLNVAAGIGSDYEKARVLTAAARDYKMSAALRAAYLRVARGIASESERQRALAALPSSGMI